MIMSKTKNILKIIISIALTVIILFPLVTQFFHVLEGNQHIVCTDNSTHLHKSESDCNICDFNYTPFIYEPLPELVNKTSIEFNTKIKNSYNYLYFSKYNLSKKLRAPPYYS